ncbi:endoglucanase E-4-like [Haliotis rufescens]|uniref:endoglucanase E-4-like n=1 Tax=Haliotis rufescens TaxID=6454 RepID=UPI00201E9584|nr:endoglucanase E-4-like [Haliotis rufescens]
MRLLLLSTLAWGVLGDMTTTMQVTSQQGQALLGSFCFDLKADILGWELDVTFSKPVKDVSQYDGDVISPSSASCFTQLQMVNKPPDGVHYTGEHLCVKMMVQRCGAAVITATGVLRDLTHAQQTVPAVSTFAGAQATKYNYVEVLMKSMMFYEAQRSGKLPADNRIPWRGDSALGDKGDNGEDLTGGWYDAGGNTKFNFPMAFSTTFLTWGLIRYKDAYEKTGQLEKMYECIKWPLDYFIKCHTQPDELYVQTGDGAYEHSTWTSPERMNQNRPTFKIDADNHGSDIAMEVAAAMAAGSIAFKQKDPAYSSTLLTHAKQLYTYAMAHQGKYSDSVPDVSDFYKSYGFADENSWGAIWMYKATGDNQYLADAEQHHIPGPAWGFSWDEKNGGANILLYEATKKSIYQQDIVATFNAWLPGGTVTYTPNCLAFRLKWGPLRYSANMAYLALVAADEGINTSQYRQWAIGQIHYILGDTGRSFIAGFGNNPPQRLHHRSSSCPLLPAPCSWDMEKYKGPNPQVLYGAMVGGPDPNDKYSDDRDDTIRNEVACDYNAGLQSSVAGLQHLANGNQLPSPLQPVCPQ